MPSMFKSPPKPPPPPPPPPVAPVVPVAEEKKQRRRRGAGKGATKGRTSTLLSDEKLGGG